MAFDRTTEAIAHFGGWFQLSSEQARMRLEYELFRREQAEKLEAEAKAGIGVNVKHSFKLASYDPDLEYDPGIDPLPKANLPFKLPIELADTDFIPPFQAVAIIAHLPVATPSAGGFTITFELLPPSSLAHYSVQTNFMSDDDIFGNIANQQFTVPQSFEDTVVALAAIAESLIPIRLESFPDLDTITETALDLLEQIQDTVSAFNASAYGAGDPDVTQAQVQDTLDGLSITLISGEDAYSGIFIDGEGVEDFLEFSEIKPLYFRLQDEETEVPAADDDAEDDGENTGTTITITEESTTSTDPDDHDFQQDFTYDILTPQEIEDQGGHEVVAGANTAVNTVNIASNWLDASNIVVGGDWIQLDIANQVNFLVDNNTGGGAGSALPNNVFNIVQFEEVSSEAEDEEDLEDEEDEETTAVGAIGTEDDTTSDDATDTDTSADTDTDTDTAEDTTEDTDDSHVGVNIAQGGTVTDGQTVSSTTTIEIENDGAGPEEDEAAAQDGENDEVQAADGETSEDDQAAESDETSSASAEAASEDDSATTDDGETTDEDTADEDEAEEAEVAAPVHSGGPVASSVVTISGDLVQLNTVQQYTFASDNDQANIEFGASTTFIGLGDNDIFNTVNAFEAGFGYDIIFVSGSVINIDIVNQINVLLDSDAVNAPVAVPAGDAGADADTDTGADAGDQDGQDGQGGDDTSQSQSESQSQSSSENSSTQSSDSNSGTTSTSETTTTSSDGSDGTTQASTSTSNSETTETSDSVSTSLEGSETTSESDTVETADESSTSETTATSGETTVETSETTEVASSETTATSYSGTDGDIDEDVSATPQDTDATQASDEGQSGETGSSDSADVATTADDDNFAAGSAAQQVDASSTVAEDTVEDTDTDTDTDTDADADDDSADDDDAAAAPTAQNAALVAAGSAIAATATTLAAEPATSSDEDTEHGDIGHENTEHEEDEGPLHPALVDDQPGETDTVLEGNSEDAGSDVFTLDQIAEAHGDANPYAQSLASSAAAESTPTEEAAAAETSGPAPALPSQSNGSPAAQSAAAQPSDDASEQTQDDGTASETGTATSASETTTEQDTADDDTPSDQSAGAEDDAEEVAPPISTGDNLLINQVVLSQTGIDTQEEVGGAFADALNDLDDGAESVSEDLENQGVFEEVEFLRILYIEGDLISINNLEQTNIITDADQLNVAITNATQDLVDDIMLTTGSNILANTASVNTAGVDSTVMTQGDVYSDALIHQAEFIDENAAPDGVNLNNLATEAVAFLADGLIDHNPADDLINATIADIADSGLPADIMQSLLS